MAATLTFGACGSPGAPPRVDLASLERWFDSTRFLRDQIDVTAARGAVASVHGTRVADLEAAYREARVRLETELERVEQSFHAVPAETPSARDGTPGDSGAEPAAVARMRAVFDRVLGPIGAGRRASRPDTAGCPMPADPNTDPALNVDPERAASGLAARVFACYGLAAGRIAVGTDTLDRLTILGLLGETSDRGRREQLFRALDPVWRSVNGDDGPASPYRRLVAWRRAAYAPGETPISERARSFGLAPDTAEAWLLAGLEAWRATLPDPVLDPWDYYHLVGAAARRLAARVPFDSLLPINHRIYRAIGADPDRLGVRYDVAPRAGKYPVAYTTFGARGGARRPGEYWVFASYRRGGIDNLAELLHETGHAVHIAAIDTRPAFHDWPDADPFTEGVADLVAHDLYEPAWQLAQLGDSVPLGISLRAKYGSIMLDFAWALFELRVHRPDARSPNAEWSEITHRYLRIRPHPELSWWAMRGQLIEAPGYMFNYALGAYLAADLRAELSRRHGNLGAGWYDLVSRELFRFGAAEPARDVVTRFLGRPLGSGALLDDLSRIARVETASASKTVASGAGRSAVRATRTW